MFILLSDHFESNIVTFRYENNTENVKKRKKYIKNLIFKGGDFFYKIFKFEEILIII